MGLLKSVDNVPGINYYEYRDYEFYNKYIYRARITLPGIRFTWYVKNSDEFNKRLQQKRFGMSWSVRDDDKKALENNAPAICQFLEFRNKLKKDKAGIVRIEGNTAAVFSNDLALLQELNKIVAKDNIDFTEVKISEFVGTKFFTKEPKHKFRIYFKSKRAPDGFIANLSQTLAQSKFLYPSKGLKRWLAQQSNWKWRYVSSGYYIDYNDESTLSYVALLYGDLLGRRYKLEKRPDTE